MVLRKNQYFEIYIPKVLAQLSPGNGITRDAKQQLSDILCRISEIVSSKALLLLHHSKKKTLSDKEVINVFNIILPGELAIKTIEESTTAISQDKSRNIFPPFLCDKFLRIYSGINITKKAPIALASALEYITAELLRLALCIEKNVRITVKTLDLAVHQDIEFRNLFTKYSLMFLVKSGGTGSDKFCIPKAAFKKMIRTLLPGCKICPKVFVILHLYIEQNIIQLLNRSNLICKQSNRIKLLSSDIILANTI